MKRVGLLGMALLLLGSVFITEFGPQVAHAQDLNPDPPRFIDRLYVQYAGDTWGNPNPYNVHGGIFGITGGFTYIRNWKWQDGLDAAFNALDEGDGCEDYMQITDLNGTPKATIYLRSKDNFGDCKIDDTRRNVNMENTGNKFVNAYRRDDENIFVPAGIGNRSCGELYIPTGTNFRRDQSRGAPNKYFKIQSDGVLTENTYLETGSGPNADIVRNLNGCPTRLEDVVLRNNGSAVTGEPGSCIPRIENPPSNACPSNDPSDPTTGGNGGGAGTDVQSCEESNGGVILSWFLCAVLNFFDNTVQTLGNIVDDLLQINRAYYTDSDLREAWSYFRNIASFLLIIIGLVMIIGQAITKG